ncbi:MAG: cupin domain-containing protein [Burkholderiales bacterium]|nr:cupin domain-containing protein [Burkholderiales bacterium]
MYPVGIYVKNPPGSRHAPISETGCALVVKLRQMEDRDSEKISK